MSNATKLATPTLATLTEDQQALAAKWVTAANAVTNAKAKLAPLTRDWLAECGPDSGAVLVDAALAAKFPGIATTDLRAFGNAFRAGTRTDATSKLCWSIMSTIRVRFSEAKADLKRADEAERALVAARAAQVEEAKELTEAEQAEADAKAQADEVERLTKAFDGVLARFTKADPTVQAAVRAALTPKGLTLA
jgi:hypothetical protein